MIPFLEIIRPASINEAIQILSAHSGEARVIAGGTDIIVGFQQSSPRFATVKRLIDLSALLELRIISREGDRLLIGAAATFADLMSDSNVTRYFPLLAKAASTIGSVQIRNRATIGGNFINNAPCADSVPPLLVYEANVHIQSLQHQRVLSLQEFLLKPYRTQLQPDEMVTHISLPLLTDQYRGDFYKLGRRRAVSISRITLALLLKQNDGKIEDIRLASGAVTPIGVRLNKLEKQALGQELSEDFLKDLSIELGREIFKVSGLRWSSPYKIPVVQQAFYQMLTKTVLSGMNRKDAEGSL